MTKSSFERILSLIDRRRILIEKVEAQSFFFCKSIDGVLFQFFHKSMSRDGHVDGIVKTKQMSKVKSKAILCLFHVGRDRYFLATKIVKLEDGYRLLNSAHFYKLNRREHYRIAVPKRSNIYIQLKSINRHPVKDKVPLLDFSAAGGRVDLSFFPDVVRETMIIGHLIWFKEKSIPIQAQIKHQNKKGVCGLRFIFTDSIMQSRFKMMSIELQQHVHFS